MMPVQAPVPPARDPEAVREATRQILERPEFQQNESVLAKASRWFGDPIASVQEAIDWLLGRVFSSSEANVSAAWILAIVVAAAIAFFVFRLVHGTPVGAVVAEEKQPMVKEKANDLIADAERFEQQEDWRQAIRCRHAALLVSLSSRGALRRRPGVTAREYVFELADSTPGAASDFDEATTLFERAWYGPEDPARSDVERFRDLAKQVRRKAAA